MKLIENVRIENFKSLRDVLIGNCKRFNLLIGKPNVGKSNIIEALTIFTVPYISSKEKVFSSFLRVDKPAQLFYNGDVSTEASIVAGEYSTTIKYKNSQELTLKLHGPNDSREFNVVDLHVRKPLTEYPTFKTYLFSQHGNNKLSTSIDMPFLCPLGGNNLMRIVNENSQLTALFQEILKPYNLKLIFNTAEQEINISKEIDNTASYIVPFDGIADTLKRYLFFAAAIMSNEESVIMFEEPEAHAYPPMISKITQLIVENPKNQYFITTHSPYVLNEFLSGTTYSDLAIHLIDYKNGETIVRSLSEEELEEVYNDGIDLFFNHEIFLD